MESKDKKDKKYKSTIGDYLSTSVPGSILGGLVGGTYSANTKGGISQPFYTPGLEGKGVDDFDKALKSKNRFFKNTVKGIGVGAIAAPLALAGYNKLIKKDKDEVKIPTPVKALAGASAGALGAGLYGHRGKLTLMAKGRLDDFDLWKGRSGFTGMLKKEKWIKEDAYKQLASNKHINNSTTQDILSENITPVPKQNTKGNNFKGTKDISKSYKELENKKDLQPIGGDPEVSLSMKMLGKKLPISVAGHPSGKSPLKNYKSDFSVLGTEVEHIKPGTPSEVVGEVQKRKKELNNFLEGSGVEIEPLTLNPSSSSSMNINRRTAGGHLHYSFPSKTQGRGKKGRKERIKYQDRLNAGLIPFDFTHPSGPARSGLSARRGKDYGTSLIDSRSAKPIAAWEPKKGYGNMEYRLGTSYMSEDPDLLNKKLELSQILLNADDNQARRLDSLASNIRKSTKNKSKNLYQKDIRKEYSSQLKTILKEDFDIEDETYNNLLDTYAKGKTRK